MTAITLPSLDTLARQHSTDKSTVMHGYTRWYEQYLGRLRHTPITLLELGIGGHEDPTLGGASLRMWRDYFPNATVIGLDIEQKEFGIDGVHIVQGDQASPSAIADLAELYGPFDVIIDDASHVSSLSIRSLELLWPHLVPGGWYFVEDTHSSYHDFYYGQAEADPNPSHRADETICRPTMMGFLKRLADEANFNPHDDGDWSLFPREHWKGYHVESVTFTYNLAAVRKHPNPKS